MPVWLHGDMAFPPVHTASSEGVVAVGGDLSPKRLLTAYAHGIFPWYDAQTPVLWWSPDPRCVLPLHATHRPRRLVRILRKTPYTLTHNVAFGQVLARCADVPRAGDGGTWLIPAMRRAYMRLHLLGYALSVEAWHGECLVGGIYGVCLGRAFFGESMFHLAPNAGWAAFFGLVDYLVAAGYTLFDCQQETPHMRRVGAVSIPRDEFLQALTAAVWSGVSPEKITQKITPSHFYS